MTLLEARELTHAYRRSLRRRQPTLQGLHLQVQAGEIWGVVGDAGSGKSTLLRILAGLCAPYTGEVLVDGHPAGSRAARRLTAFAPETLAWPPGLSVNDVLAELAALTSARGILDRVDRVARALSLEALLDLPLASLSRAQGRAVILAQAFLDGPRLVLLDQPFSELDIPLRWSVRRELRRLAAAGTGVVCSTRDPDDLADLATHVMVLREGRIESRGPAGEVLAALPARADVAVAEGPA